MGFGDDVIIMKTSTPFLRLYLKVLMKFKYLYLGLTVLLASCNSNSNNKESDSNSSDSSGNSEYALSKADMFQDYLDALDTTDINSIDKANKKFKEIFNPGDTINNDKGVVDIVDFMNKVAAYGHQSAIDDDIDYSGLVDIEIAGGKAPGKLEDAYEKIKKNGFRIRQSEGMYSLQINPFFIQKEFYPYISSNMEIMLQQIAKENLEGYAEDAAITIPYQSLVQRVVWWEDFLKNNSNKAYTALAQEQYGKYFNALIIGMDNTPAIESEQIAPYFQEAYSYLKDFAPNSTSYQQLQPYIDLLEQGKIEEAKGFVEGLLKR